MIVNYKTLLEPVRLHIIASTTEYLLMGKSSWAGTYKHSKLLCLHLLWRKMKGMTLYLDDMHGIRSIWVTDASIT